MAIDNADTALSDALWRADNIGAGEPNPIGNFADAYVVLAQEVRVWLRKNGFDVIRLPNKLYEDHTIVR